MKKIICLILAAMMILSLTACGGDKSDAPTKPSKPGIENTTPEKENDNGAMKPSPDDEELKYPLPELVPDGEYSVDLSADQVIYDKDGIKVTYKGLDVGMYGYKMDVIIENNKEDNLHFMPCSAVINGVNMSPWFDTDVDLIAKGETLEGIVWMDVFSPAEEINYDVANIKCFDFYFGFYTGEMIYGATQTVIDNNVLYSFTKGQHDHRNDERKIVGELIYENDEMAIYLEKTFEEIPDKYYSYMTYVNKTSRTICIDSFVECRYNSAPVRPHYTAILGDENYIAPNSYVASRVYIDEEHSSLDMIELIFKKQCYYATLVYDAVKPEQDVIDYEGIISFEKMNCFYDRINVNINVIKDNG